MKQTTCRRILIPVTAGIIFLCLFFLLPAYASEEISYSVSFVDTEDYSTKIFNTQSGSVAEGISVSVTFPEILIGSDGHIWRSLEESPQKFEVLQSGTHKYYIEYRQGEKRKKPEDPDKEDNKKLEQWLQTAWETDCIITGQDPKEQHRPELVVTENSGNNNRIRNLVSIINDADWHYFYMIGRNYLPQTLVAGTELNAEYSTVMEETFSVKADKYYVVKVGVRRSWNSKTCFHNWSLNTDTTGDDGVTGMMVYGCTKCGLEEVTYIPGAAEPHYWKEGDAQLRRIGGKYYRFICVDEDYSDSKDGHRKAALFLCDSVIRSDIDSDDLNFKKNSFGEDNNYKTSKARAWLSNHVTDSLFNAEPLYIGVNTAYSGSTMERTFEQMVDSRLIGHKIGFQLMQDQLFCLSLEEAIKYRQVLWQFNGSEENNPESQLSPYSVGYYLRTPFYMTDDKGIFQYSKDIYVVDLAKGNIHTAETDSETYGLRPAFALEQE